MNNRSYCWSLVCPAHRPTAIVRPSVRAERTSCCRPTCWLLCPADRRSTKVCGLCLSARLSGWTPIYQRLFPISVSALIADLPKKNPSAARLFGWAPIYQRLIRVSMSVLTDDLTKINPLLPVCYEVREICALCVLRPGPWPAFYSPSCP